MSKQNTEESQAAAGWVRLRPRLVLSLAVVMALGYFGHTLWQQFEPDVSQHPQYAITPDRILLPQKPPWIRGDIRAEVLRDARLVGQISLLDDGDMLARIKQALEFHPWVESVQSVRKQLPAGIAVELTYRQPVAAVETTGEKEIALLPVDRHAIRLPEDDLPMNERVYLPRITGVMGRPSIGQAWDDPRVTAGVRLAGALAEVWQSLRLVEIVPVPTQAAEEIDSADSFEIVTRGGTRIVWGAAPGDEPPGESPFATKLQRLRQYAQEHNNLHTIDGPKLLDVRGDLQVEYRTAEEKRALLAAQAEKAADEVATRDDENTTR